VICLPLFAWMRIIDAGELVQRSWQDNDGNKRQFQSASVGPAVATSAKEKTDLINAGVESPSPSPTAPAKGDSCDEQDL
jgi:single-stranded DNA-binding protein